jgi:biotin transport system substrate-specific component
MERPVPSRNDYVQVRGGPAGREANMPEATPYVHPYERFRADVIRFHEWHREINLALQVLLVLAWAGVMGLLAQIAVPFYPVPFTMQTFGVVFGAVLLGMRKGVAAQAVYVGAGYLGVPWFQGFQAGVQVVTTTGYLVGFIVAACFIAFAVHRLRIRTYWGLVGAMTIGAAIIFVLGWLWLAFFAPIPGTHGFGAWNAFLLGVLPFIPGDIAKIMAAAGLALPFLPAASAPPVDARPSR